jgi:hypothetical protein
MSVWRLLRTGELGVTELDTTAESSTRLLNSAGVQAGQPSCSAWLRRLRRLRRVTGTPATCCSRRSSPWPRITAGAGSAAAGASSAQPRTSPGTSAWR